MRAERVNIQELQLGDVVDLGDGDHTIAGGYMTATVTQVGEERVVLTRPYVHTADFSYGDGGRVIPYLGWEEIDVTGDRKLLRIRKGQVIR